MIPMTLVHRATSAVVVVRCQTIPQKHAVRFAAAPRRGNLSCNAVPKWKRKNKKSSEAPAQAPRVNRERRPDTNRESSGSSWSLPAPQTPASAPTKRVPKWLKRKKSGQASPGTGPRPVGTMVFDVGGVPSSVKRVPRWLRRAKTSGQSAATPQQQPARPPARNPENRGFSYDGGVSSSGVSKPASSGQRPSNNNRNAQPEASSGGKRYPKWHRRYKKNPGLTPEQEFAIQRDRMASRHNWNGPGDNKPQTSLSHW